MQNLDTQEIIILAEVLECLRCLKNIPDMLCELQENNKLTENLIDILIELKGNLSK